MVAQEMSLTAFRWWLRALPSTSKAGVMHGIRVSLLPVAVVQRACHGLVVGHADLVSSRTKICST
jgi:hypothetical protein